MNKTNLLLDGFSITGLTTRVAEEEVIIPHPKGNQVTQTIRMSTYPSLTEFVEKVYSPKALLSVHLDANFMNRDKPKNSVHDNASRSKSLDDEYKSSDPFICDDYRHLKKEMIGYFNDVAYPFLHSVATKYSLPLTGKEFLGKKLINFEEFTDTWLHDDSLSFSSRFSLEEQGLMYKTMALNDLIAKWSILRKVNPYWFAVSYRGTRLNDEVQSYLPELASVFERISKRFAETGAYSKLEKVFDADIGDPIDTFTGWPFDSGETTAEGVPVAKLKNINAFAGVGRHLRSRDALMDFINNNPKIPDQAKKYPFAFYATRRTQPGGSKFVHWWKSGARGWVLDRDVKGFNTTRVAWMASYPLNVITSPLQILLKSFRKLTPFLYSDGEAKKVVTDICKDPKMIYLESDYSNYDRTIPPDFLNALVSAIVRGAGVSDELRRKADLLMQLCNHDNWIVLPDWSDVRGKGIAFQVDKSALFSGLKITGEGGSIANLGSIFLGHLINKTMTADELVSYATKWLDSVSIRSSNKSFASWADFAVREPSKFSWYKGFGFVMIQSDDTEIISTDEKRSRIWAKAFVKGATILGFKSSLSFGDRYLMRSLFLGGDEPVGQRIMQNSISSEEPEIDALIFLVGLAMRSEGINFVKTFDPFGTNTTSDLRRKIFNSPSGKPYVDYIQKSLRWMSNLITQQKSEVARPVSMYLDALSDSMTGSVQSLGEVDRIRKSLLNSLATREKDKAEGLNDLGKSLYYLWKNRFSPGNAMLLEQMIFNNEAMQANLKSVISKESKVYKFACLHMLIEPYEYIR